MPLFSRKNKTEELAKAVAAELAKNVGPYPAGTYSQASAAAPYTNSNMSGQIQIAGESVPMDRPAGAFGAILGPSAPMLPAPLDPVLDDSGRALPRKYEYEVATNLNITQTAVPYAVLKALAEQCDIIHRCIEIRVSELTKMDWSFALAPGAISEIMEEQNVSHARAAKIGRERYGEELVRLTEFWENPYVAIDRSFKEWLTEALWQSFVYDQLCIYPRYTLGKKLIGFDVIDAPTIKILLDNRGDIPHPPVPAYQQILWGFPRGEFTASPDTDTNGSFYAGAGRANQFLTDQLYVSVKNRRTWTPYGYSPVEQAIPAATLYLERQRWMRAEYTEGAAPKTWMRTSSKDVLMDPLKLAAYERVLNDRLAGSTSERNRVKVLPDGFDPVSMQEHDEKYRADYDEFIIKRIASTFGVAPSALGVVPRSGLGGAGEHKGERDSVDAISAKPMENYVVEFINSLSRRFLGADKNVTFVLDDQANAENESEKTKAFQIALSSGQMTLNDVRGEMGYPLYDDPSADEPFISTPQGPVYFRGTLGTDGSGETTAQIGEPNGESPQSAQGPQSQEIDQEPQAPQEPSVGEGKETEANLKAAEIQAFRKFAKTPRNRKFIFEHHTPEEIELIKRQIIDTPKGQAVTKRQGYEDLPGHGHRQSVIDKHRAGLISGISISVSGWRKAVEQAVAAAPAQSADTSALTVIANQALQHNIDGAASELSGTLTNLASDAAQAAGENLRVPLVKQGERLKQILSEADRTAEAIRGTTLSRIRSAIVNGMEQGQSSKQIADQINALINDPTRADLIAVTETNSSYNAAYIDSLAASGQTQWWWEAYTGACEICVGSVGLHDLQDAYPDDGSHPNCRCTVLDQQP